MDLRPYQAEAVGAIMSARRAGLRRLLVCLPTGAGKTVIFARLAQLARRQVLVLAHREELLQQARETLAAALGGAHDVALERGGERGDPAAKVLVCSIRSLGAERLSQIVAQRELGLVVYDECHHAAAEDNLRVLRQIGVFDAGWDGTLLGFTATTARGDGRGLDQVFEKIVYSRSLPELIEDGFLARLRGFRISTNADLTRLSAGGADFSDDELSEAVDIEERNALVARSIQELARDRRSIAFCVTVNHAQNLSRSLNALGVAAGVVHGAMPSEQRARALAEFRAGRVQVICNVAVLTEGFDDPGVSCVVMARPTRSEGLYAQCVGRGTRLHPGKRDCLILDFADVSELSLCSLPSLFGVPARLDLRGEDASVARRVWEQILFDRPGFELEAQTFTLPEIQRRAESFDPLTLELDPSVPAISANAWFSLGRYGVGLFFERYPGAICEVTVLCRGARGKRWEVCFDGRLQERFSTVEQAVEAVDYEVARKGPRALASARPEAAWRAERAELLRSDLWRRVASAERRTSR